jgi:hypothetical protein
MMEQPMRPSVLATLVFIGLIGIGIRAQTLTTDPRPRTEAVVRHGKVIKPAPPPPALPAVTVVGHWRSSEEDARESAFEQAQERLGDWVRAEYPGLNYLPPIDAIKASLVKGSRVQKYTEALPDEAPTTSEGGTLDLSGMRRVTLELELTPDFQSQVRRLDSDLRVHQRMGILGGLLGLVVLGLGSLAAYIRLDEWTRGYYTNRLRLAALAVVGAGVAAAVWLV